MARARDSGSRRDILSRRFAYLSQLSLSPSYSSSTLTRRPFASILIADDAPIPTLGACRANKCVRARAVKTSRRARRHYFSNFSTTSSPYRQQRPTYQPFLRGRGARISGSGARNISPLSPFIGERARPTTRVPIRLLCNHRWLRAVSLRSTFHLLPPLASFL